MPLSSRAVNPWSAHAVVLEGREPLVGHEPKLVDQVVTGAVAEHAEVRGVLEPETRLALGHASLSPRHTT
ncbi:MAG: hypothetical protein ACYTA3_09795 [Planctomycetota bacterium]